MRVLAHIHTFNDADIIDRTIEGVLRQTRPVDGILLVDNASIDGTLDRPSVRNTTVLRHSENLGTSGAVHSGFSFALQHGYDWIWVFDADSIPEPDALEKLLTLYSEWPSSQQNETAFLACRPRHQGNNQPDYRSVFSSRGFVHADPEFGRSYYPCHVAIWSGCLYRLAAVCRVGMPNPDYVLDWGEGEYGYRVMKAGYKGFVCKEAILNHDIRGYPSLTSIKVKLGPLTLNFRELAPIRCYYTCRNPLYFALYDSVQERLCLFQSMARLVLPLTLNFVVRPYGHSAQLRACLRGLWHGLTGNVTARY